tara:strand:- start:258 stop:497 length:240 start_codon:yes stop_codon:yes gene_type:complete
MRNIFILLPLSVGIISCNQQTSNSDLIEETVEQNSFNEQEFLNIHINNLGDVSVNGMLKSLQELDPFLEKVKKKNGVNH